jgi:phosphoglycolate phosphatase-like HAD superfamily hydrolase
VINLLFTHLERPPVLEKTGSWTAYRGAMHNCDVSALARFLNSEDSPLIRLLDGYGRPIHAFVKGLYSGDVGSGNIIKQIFQEIYLGKDLFASTYGIEAEVYHGEGFINKENLLISEAILEQLSKNNTLAIATGRPKAEADYPLDHFRIRKFFKTVYTLDDCLHEEEKIFVNEGKKVSLSKPDPFMLDAIAGSIQHKVSKYYYIGDMPDDMIAASRAGVGFTGIGVVISSPDKKRLKEDLKKAGAHHIIDNFNEMLKIL